MAKAKRHPKSPRNAQTDAERKAKAKADRQQESVMPAIELEDFLRRAADDRFWTGDPIWAVRGHAIQRWANVEQSLCALFCHLTGMPMDVGAIVFFKIINTGTRDSLLEILLEKKYGSHYRAFWESLQKILKPATDTRNHIVHWQVTNRTVGAVSYTCLVPPPKFWDMDAADVSLAAEDLLEFMSRCSFIFDHCDMFWRILDPVQLERLGPVKADAWRDIFQQPVIYPPHSNHPLYRRKKEDETQQSPSQE